MVVRRVPKQVPPIDHKNTTFLNIARKSIIEVKQHYEAVTNLHKVKVDLLTQNSTTIPAPILPEKEILPLFPAFGARTSLDRGQRRVIDLVPTTLPYVNNPENDFCEFFGTLFAEILKNGTYAPGHLIENQYLRNICQADSNSANDDALQNDHFQYL